MTSARVSAGEDNHVFVVDDDRSVRRALGRLLTSAGYCVESFESAEQFLESGFIGHAGCIIVDIEMPGINGLELQHRLVEEMVDMPVVFLTGHGDIPMSVRAMRAGAVDFLTKPVKRTDLLRAVNAAMAAARSRHDAVEATSAQRARVAKLTPREREVMLHVIAGKLNKVIAADLGTTEHTIKVHRGRVMDKLEVSSVAELVHLARSLGIAPAS